MREVRHSRPFMFFVFMALILWGGTAFGQANVKGQWTTLANTMPINPIHSTLLPNGKILIVAGSGNCPPSLSGCPSGPPYGPSNASGAGLYDPIAKTFTQFTLSWDMFCNGMVNLADGRVLINGGTIQYDPFFGSPKNAIFDPATNTFTDVQNMAVGRWYPTPTVLGDGRVMTFSGLDTQGNTTDDVEIYTIGSGWSSPAAAGWTPPLYPRMHLLPSGKVLYSGSGTNSALFDPATFTWTRNIATTNYSGTRTYGTSVLLPLSPATGYDPKVMIFGGNSPATNTTEIIDMGAASPKWVFGPNMSQPRIEMNAVILPNGKVLALGGSKNDEDTATLSLNADLYDPVSNTFSSAGANASQRLYHSSALLLPDATVWLAGGNPQRGSYNNTIEIYQPAYLFNSSGALATRPTITSAPTVVGYGNQFTVQTPDAANITSAVFMRDGSVTHAFDMDQRMVVLSFTTGSGSLTLTAPPNGNIAPPGFYMLFLLNSTGVPSIAKIVQLGTQVQPDFSFAATPNLQSVTPGNSANYNLAVGASGGFNGSVTFSVSGLPAGATSSFSPTSVTGSGNSVMTISTSAATPIGTYPLTITATSGSLVHTTPVTLGVGSSTVNFSGGFTSAGMAFNGSAALNGTRLSLTDGGANEAASAFYTTPVNVQSFTTDFTIQLTNPTADGMAFVIQNAGTTALGPGGGGLGYGPPAPGGAAGITPSVAVKFDLFSNSGEGTNSTGLYTAGASPTTPAITLGGGVDLHSGDPLNVHMTYDGTTLSMTITDANVPADTFTTSWPINIPSTVGGNTALVGFTAGTGGLTATQEVLSWIFTNSTQPTAAPPTFSPTPGTYTSSVSVTLSDTTPGATIYYTTNGSTPTTSSTVFTAPIPVSTTTTIKAIAAASGFNNSNVATGAYTISTGTAPPPAFVQGATGPPTIQSSNSTVAVAFPTVEGSGHLNVVAVGWGDTTSTITSVTDTQNNVYALAVGPTANGTGLSQAIYYAKNILGGTNTVTVKFSKAAAYPDVRILEYSGADLTNPVDKTIASTGSSSTANSGSVTTTSPNELIFGAGTTAASFTAAGSGFTSRMINIYGNIAEDRAATTAGSYNATATTGSAAWIMQLVAFRGPSQTAPAPTVTSISPTSGTTAGGTAVTITGTGFLAGASVTIGGTAATGVSVTNSTSITATTPAHTAGAGNVVVSNTDGQSGTLSNGYTYTSPNPAPTVTGISPASGPIAGGTAVTITGTGFLSGATVKLGGTSATNVTVVSATSITATAPAHAAGAVSVVITNTDGQSGTLNNGYTYTNPAPTVTSISPTSGTTAGGTAVTITGTGFLSGATVTLGGTAATNVTVVSATSITARTPAHAAGAVDVVVTNTDTQNGTLTNGYTYNPAPTVTSISPTSGTTAGGTAVTITGTGFLAGASVTIGGTAATGVSVTNSTSITATTPAHTAGAGNVVVSNTDGQSGTLSNGYTYTSPNPAPTVTGISPASGPIAGGTAVTITGTGFLSGATVKLGGTSATNVTVVSATSITATAPAHAAGAVSVVVTNSDGQSGTLNNGYTYTNPAPTVTSISPTSGTTAGGTAVTITGTGFLSGAAVTLGGTAATNVTVVSATSITATSPAHAAGPVNVVVTNTDTQSATLTNGYTYSTSSGGSITFVQAASGPSNIQSSNSTLAVAYPAAQVAGHLNVVVIGWGDNTSTITSVTDSQNNTYSLAIGPTSTTGLSQAIYYAKNVAGGSNTVTVKFSKAAAYPDVRILDYSGADTVAPLDKAAGATGSGTAANSGSVTTTASNELIFGAGTTETIFTAPGSGFVSRMVNIFGNIAEDRNVTASGSYNATATTNSSRWIMQVVTFK